MILENGYNLRDEKKNDIAYVRMNKSMLKQLQHIKDQTGISKSELIREAVRRLINESIKDYKVRICM